MADDRTTEELARALEAPPLNEAREVVADFMLQGHLTYCDVRNGSDYDKADALRRDLEAEGVSIVPTQLLRAAAARLRDLEARVERMTEALEPFAVVAEYDIGENEADTDRYRPMSPASARGGVLMVGHLRRARALTGGEHAQREGRDDG